MLRYELYEDGGGGIHLYDVGNSTLYSGIEWTNDNPAIDAAILAYYPEHAESWNVLRYVLKVHEYIMAEGERLIAVYEFPPDRPPGKAGHKALGIPEYYGQ